MNWALLGSNVSTVGSHTVTVWLESSNTPVDAWVDHLLITRDKYITVKGLKPGDVVQLYDSQGNLLVQVKATGPGVRIDATKLGIYRFPMQGKIVVLR